MKRQGLVAVVWAILVLVAGMWSPAIIAQSKATDSAATQTVAEFEPLVGQWVRPDGGYRVTIRSVGADGKLDASYENPALLAFSRAEATREGEETRVFFELTAGGYNGSTYTLTFDPDEDVLRGVYYQANAQRSYDIFFERGP
jgi:uncharacterized protein (DUF2147 family)